MSVLKYWLLISAMLLSLSTSTAIELRDYQAHNLVEHNISLASIDGLARKLTTRAGQSGKPIFDKESPRVQTHRSVLFLSDIQAEPEFVEVVDLGMDENYHPARENIPLKPIPWYMLTSNKDRVGGWRDGNNLYKAQITYHA